MRLLGLLVWVWVATATVAAQDVVMAIAIAQGQRVRTFISASYTVPTEAVGYARLATDIPTADYEDPTNSLTARLYALDPDTQTWRVIAGTRWVGGRLEDPELGVNPQPSMEFEVARLRGQTVRVELDVPKRMRVGASLTILPAPTY